MVLPASYTLSSKPSHIGPYPFALEGSGDLHEGILNGSTVRVKMVRMFPEYGPKIPINVRYCFDLPPTAVADETRRLSIEKLWCGID